MFSLLKILCSQHNFRNKVQIHIFLAENRGYFCKIQNKCFLFKPQNSSFQFDLFNSEKLE
ncbi:hypothetical protein BpHYR1_017764 [Brachionus plicatilis]|uniref:Uncharacterized protein n=1 Tax=Brachionus plicatilis TaxID=10195 RepID=A0A3M7S6D6_BRAPC|nr:hypothetical protein BpHYR1_017764 [Brachionus plicatilis]